MLDAARDLVLDSGPRAAGIRAIAQRTGAPTGSLYHRFGSRDGVVAHAWLRAVRRFQAGFSAALADSDPRRAIAAGAAWTVLFALAEPADARLLLTYGPSALLDGDPPPDVAEALSTVNEPIAAVVKQLASRIYGSQERNAVERVTFAMVDLPYAVVRRHLHAGTLTADTADAVAVAAGALIAGAL